MIEKCTYTKIIETFTNKLNQRRKSLHGYIKSNMYKMKDVSAKQVCQYQKRGYISKMRENCNTYASCKQEPVSEGNDAMGQSN